MDHQQVVITGLGALTPLGCSVNEYWDGLIHGRSGIRRITLFDASHLPCQIAGEVPDFDPSIYMDRKTARRMPRSSQFAVAAARQALADAGLDVPLAEPERTGVLFATAVGGLDHLTEGNEIYINKGYDRMPPLYLPSGIPNVPAFLIAHQFQCLGPNNTISTACATGTQAIGEAAELIRRGAADMVITGGTDTLVIDFGIASFSAMHALPIHFNDQPERASRPFDLKREGFILSEGAGALVLESENHAMRAAGAMYAEVAGHASSADAHHLAAPGPDGLGPGSRHALGSTGCRADP